jgi:TetR/AcrR family transcriptional regulator, cholesterol catabolism regulator
MSIETRIVIEAGELFFRHGIRTITMDDIANALGMSKKTIYQYYKDKNLLVQSLTDRILHEQVTVMNDIRKRTENPIVEILLVLEHITGFFSKINPNLFYDLQKYHPHAWYSFKLFKEKELIGFIEENLKRGIADELYRKEINVKILARLRIEQVEWGFNTKVFHAEKFSITDVQVNLLDHFLHGIVSLKGYKQIEKHKSQIIQSFTKI